jgi:hypothetical protein
MIKKFISVLSLSLVASICNADFIEQWGLNYNVIQMCIPESDVCSNAVSLNGSANDTIKIEGLAGPIILALENKQIISCESNAILKTEGAKLFNLAGVELAAIPHRGFMRHCGITTDGLLYWFHYNKVLNSSPVNVLVVVTSTGKIVFEQIVKKGGKVKFNLKGKEYAVSIQEPEWPG